MNSNEIKATTIATQNVYLDSQSPTYIVAAGGDGDLFEMRGNVLYFIADEYTKNAYDITIISTDDFAPSNSRDMTVTVSGGPDLNTATISGMVFR